MTEEKTKLTIVITQEEKEKIRKLAKKYERGNMTAFIIRMLEEFEKKHDDV